MGQDAGDLLYVSVPRLTDSCARKLHLGPKMTDFFLLCVFWAYAKVTSEAVNGKFSGTLRVTKLMHVRVELHSVVFNKPTGNSIFYRERRIPTFRQSQAAPDACYNIESVPP